MRQDYDAQRDWDYGEKRGSSDGPLWSPPQVPRAGRLGGMGRYYTLMIVLGLVFIVSIGGAVLAFISSGNDPTALDAEELDQLIAARQNAGGTDESNSTVETSTPVRTTTLSVYSDPPDATVLLDYDSVGVTPLQNHEILPGIYILSVAEGSDVRLDTVIVVREGGPEGSVSIDLDGSGDTPAASMGELAQRSDEAVESRARDSRPPAVQPDPEPVEESRTQSTRTADPPLAQTTRERNPETTRESPDREQPAREQPTRRPPPPAVGMLSIQSTPAGAEVQLDGETVGVTPLHLQEVQPGSRRVSIHLDDHQPASAEVEVTAGQLASLHEMLQIQTGTITVLVKPWGTIYIDGELHGRNMDVQYETQLNAGQHRITVLHPALGEREQVVNVRPDETEQIVIDLTSSASATSSRQ